MILSFHPQDKLYSRLLSSLKTTSISQSHTWLILIVRQLVCSAFLRQRNEHTSSSFSLPSVSVTPQTENHSWLRESKGSCGGRGWGVRYAWGPCFCCQPLTGSITIHQAVSSLSSLQTHNPLVYSNDIQVFVKQVS